MTLPASLLLAAVTIGTWNGEWFPSGRAEHRAAPEIEQGAVRAAGRMLRAGLAQADPAGTNDLILCFNEFRRDTDGTSVAERLCREIDRGGGLLKFVQSVQIALFPQIFPHTFYIHRASTSRTAFMHYIIF